MIFSVHRERAIQHKKQGIRGRTLLDQQPPAQKILAGHCIKKSLAAVLRSTFGRARILRGAQPANQNAITHGRYRAAVVAERKLRAKASAEVRMKREREWAAMAPKIDYAASCEELHRANARN